MKLAFLLGPVAAALFVSQTVSVAQTPTLPQPTRTVYKCVVAKKVVYTDEPCIGAKVVDVEPSRGFNKSTGRELIGADVSREKRSEAFATAVKPVTGMTPEQFEIQKRRTKLTPEARSECTALDRSIPQSEADERVAGAKSKTSVQRALFAQRKRYRELRC
jgi:hypothetical protein